MIKMYKNHGFIPILLLGFIPVVTVIGFFIGPYLIHTPLFFRSTHTIKNFKVLWKVENLCIERKYEENAMWLHEDELYALGSLNKCGATTALSYNIHTGELRQPVRDTGDLSNPQIQSVGNHGSILYSSTLGAFRNPKGTAGSARIFAYDLKSEKEVWSKQLSAARSVTDIYIESGLLYVYVNGPGTSRYDVFEPFNGSLISTLDTSDIDISPLHYSSQVILLNDKIALAKGPHHPTSGYVEVIDKESYNKQWQTSEELVGYIGASKTTVFYLNKTAELIAANINTGEKFGSIQFQPEEINRIAYVVANDSNQVFVYFGDSRQLFAIEFTPPEAGE